MGLTRQARAEIDAEKAWEYVTEEHKRTMRQRRVTDRDPDTIYQLGGNQPYLRVVHNGYRDGRNENWHGATIEVLDEYANRAGKLILTGSGAKQLEDILRRKRGGA